MNLYFRMLIIFLKIWSGQRKRWSEESVVNFRAWPIDCDVNFHLTGSRYIGIADLGRIHLLGQMGILGELLMRRWLPIVSEVDVSYIRSIKPFEKFRLITRILLWDRKYWYTEHRFEVHGQLRALLLVRGVFVCERDIIPIPDVAALTGEDPTPPPVSETIHQWKDLLKSKKCTPSAPIGQNSLIV